MKRKLSLLAAVMLVFGLTAWISPCYFAFDIVEFLTVLHRSVEEWLHTFVRVFRRVLPDYWNDTKKILTIHTQTDNIIIDNYIISF